jgi:TnpA family transposase
MPRRSILSATERESLLAIPVAGDELIRLYTFSESDLALILQHRGAQNRLGFAVLLCYMCGIQASCWASMPSRPPIY